MSFYFTIMAELRGCYSDNESAFTIKATTRRELKEALEFECMTGLREAGAIGLSKKAIASHAAACWRRRKDRLTYPLVLGFRYPHQSGEPMGLFVYNAAREDYLKAIEESEQ